MAIKTPDKILSGPQLDILTAQKVFGWKNVHQHDGEIVGKKQDKAGRWRSAKVPRYSTDPVLAQGKNEKDERNKQLGKAEPNQKELAKITRVKKLPPEWATPEQRTRVALKAVRN